MLIHFSSSTQQSAMNEHRGHEMWNGMCRQNGMCVDGNERGIRMHEAAAGNVHREHKQVRINLGKQLP